MDAKCVDNDEYKRRHDWAVRLHDKTPNAAHLHRWLWHSLNARLMKTQD
jgi:hypothetical protein